MKMHDWFLSLYVGGIFAKPSNVSWNQIEYAINGAVGYPKQYHHLDNAVLHKLTDDNFVLACKCCGQSAMG